jgi:hypothetical protein
VKKPLGDYSTTTDVMQLSAHSWGWSARLGDHWDLCDIEQGWCWTEKRARRKAERAAQRMMRTAASWTTHTYTSKEDR